ncbi:MAG: hypothetical protein AAB352_04080 [Patescibacteria group bacterium]
MAKTIKKFFSNHKRLNAYKKKIEVFPWIIGTHAFLSILIIISLEIILGMLLFSNYALLVKFKEPKNVVAPVKLQENTYKMVLDSLQSRENIFNNFLNENYRDPFQ